MRVSQPLSEQAMLARSQIEILGDTEKYLAERVVEGARAVQPSEPQASRGASRAIGGGAKSHHGMRSSRVNLPYFP